MSYIYQTIFHVLKYSASICLNSNRIQFQGIGYSLHACGRFDKVDFYKPLMVSPLWRTYLWCMYLIFSAFMPPHSPNSNAAFNRLYALLHASARGESADLGNTFWQPHFGKNRKMHLGRGLVKPSTEVLSSPRPRYLNTLTKVLRALQTLGRGI